MELFSLAGGRAMRTSMLPSMQSFLNYQLPNGLVKAGRTNYQLPNGPVKAGRRWGQRHPQGASLGSNGILKFLSKTHTTAATSPP